MKTGAINWGNPVARCGLNDGLAGWWLARGPWVGGGTWFDLCGKNNGTLTNGPTWGRSARLGNTGHVVFDGTDDRVAIGRTGIAFGSNYTISLWVYGNSGFGTASTQVFAAPRATANNYPFVLHQTSSTSKFRFTTNAGSDVNFNYNFSPTNGVWYFLTAVKDSTTTNLYLNGELDNSGTQAVGTDNADNIALGSHNFGSGFNHFLNGRLDSFRVYPGRSLSDSEVRCLYNDEISGYPLTLNRLSRRAGYVAAATGNRRRRLLIAGTR